MVDEIGRGCGLFVVSISDIAAGDFITVDYSKQFVDSNKSNIVYFVHLLLR